MKNWFTGTIAQLSQPFRSEQSRLLGHSHLATCRACGQRKPIEGMSEIPFHGFFCSDDEAVTFWNENYASDVPAEPDAVAPDTSRDQSNPS